MFCLVYLVVLRVFWVGLFINEIIVMIVLCWLICFYSEFFNKDLKFVGNYILGWLIGKGFFGKVYFVIYKFINGFKVGFELCMLLGKGSCWCVYFFYF